VASPLRFRRSEEGWSEGQVRSALYQSLDAKLGAAWSAPQVDSPPGYDAVRFDMDDGSMALFCWNDEGGYWLGNTETPSPLWRTEKYTFDEVPYPVARWAQRILLADLQAQDPWLAQHPHVAWFFLPVFFSKDGRESSRTFFRKHAAGVPDAEPGEALSYYESVLKTGMLDDYRYEMGSKLGTSEQLDLTRMMALMGEIDAAAVLDAAGYDVTPEVEVTTGHSLDFRASHPGDEQAPLVEVTRPVQPTRRSTNSPVRAVKETVETKTSGQLSRHGGGAILFVDCTSFPDDAWAAVRAEQPDVAHRPAVVFRVRPSGRVEGYRRGNVPLALEDTVEWVEPGTRN
jgi:hypothetical protein